MKMKSKANSVLVIVFFAVIAVCSFALRTGKVVLKTEDRSAVVYPSFMKDGAFNSSYFSQLDTYLSDRFAFRKQLIRLFNSIFVNINDVPQIQNYVLDKEGDWIMPVSSIDTKATFPDRRCVSIAAAFRRLHQKCAAEGVKLYILLVPDKGMYYGKNIRRLATPADMPDQPELRDSLSKLPFVVYPVEELREAAEGKFVYFKTDHHWTEDGAYVGYLALMDRIRRDFPDIHVATEGDFDFRYDTLVRSDFNRSFFAGHNFQKLNAWYSKGKLLDTPYRYFEPKKPRHVKVVDAEKVMNKDFTQGPGRYRAMLSGTSMCENLLQILPESFAELRYRRLNVPSTEKLDFMKRFGAELKAYKPDILIICLTYNNLGRVRQLAE